MKITKNQRQNKVKEIILRWGRLNKTSIDTHISTAFTVDLTDGLKRAIYRDLDELVTNGELEILYFTRDGAQLDNFEQEVHKNYYNEWASKEFNKPIFGQSLLNSKDSDIYVSDILKNEIRIKEQDQLIDNDYRYIFFHSSSKFLNISFKRDVVPLTILISRYLDKISEKEILAIQKAIGKRFIILKVPSSSITSYKEHLSLGHMMIDFKFNDQIRVNDLESKNGSVFYKLTPIEGDEIRLKGKALVEETVSVSWDSTPNEVFAKQKIKEPLESYSPFIVELGSSFRLLII